VPGTSPSSLQCIRCQLAIVSPPSLDDAPIPKGVEPHSTLLDQATAEDLLQPPMPQADWELDAELRYIERLARAWRDHPAQAANVPDGLFPSEVRSAATLESAAERPKPEPTAAAQPRFAGLAWGCLSMGVMTFVCGGVLLGWSAATGRAQLWSIGLPLTLFGQAGLIIGLVLQLETLWQTNRATSTTLQQLDGELHELRHSTTLLTQSHSNPAQSFYVHLAEGASPHLLLADLKGQLDLLSEQMSRRR
jgi:hypothetical protein